MDKKEKKEETLSHYKIFLKWEASEYEFHTKSNKWFIVASVIAIVFFAGSILLKNFLLAILVFVGTLAIFVYAIRPPKRVKFAIADRGVFVDEQLLSYDNLQSFWIFYDPPSVNYLSLKNKKMFMPFVYIPLGSQNPAEIHKVLTRFIPEKRQVESVVDSIVRVIKF